MAKDIDASEETFLAPCPLPLYLIRVFAAESARTAAEESDEALGTRWVLAMALVSGWRLVLVLVLNLQSHPGTPH